MTFRPTPAQQAFLKAALDLNVKRTIRAISRAARVHESSWRICKRNPAFCACYRHAWESGAAHSAWLLDNIGLEKARTDFRYWQAMQQKYSFSPPGLRHPPLTVIVRVPGPFRPGPPPQAHARKARIFSRSPDTTSCRLARPASPLRPLLSARPATGATGAPSPLLRAQSALTQQSRGAEGQAPQVRPPGSS